MRTCAIAVALLTTLCLSARGETNRSWDELMKKIQIGKNVVVSPMGSGKVEGRLVAITADTITVHARSRDTEIKREEVRRVRYANIRRRNTLIGLAAGAAGGGIGSAATDDEPILAAILAGTFGGIGAAVGGLLPIGRPLYEAETRSTKRPSSAQVQERTTPDRK